jgi:hypothetical protein
MRVNPAMILVAAGLGASLFSAAVIPATSASVSRAYTTFDADKCKHTKGRGPEDYGSWRCPGHAGIDVVLGAGDQRMQVSFGRNALRELAAQQTFGAFNDVYMGTVEWRIETLPDGKAHPFATILRWNVKMESDQDGSSVSGRVLVVTRLNPGGVCHVGYVDGRANPNANELAQQFADERARTFKCGRDKPVVVGKVMPGLTMPEND